MNKNEVKISLESIIISSEVFVAWQAVTVGMIPVLQAEGITAQEIKDEEFWLLPDGSLEIRAQARHMSLSMPVPREHWRMLDGQ